MPEDIKSGYRAKIILLKDERYTVPEIRKWIHHRSNEKGIDGIISKNIVINSTSLIII